MTAETAQLNTRVDKELADRLDHLAELTGRTKVWHVTAALRAYLDAEVAFLDAVTAGRADVQAGRVVDLDAIDADLDAIEAEAAQA